MQHVDSDNYTSDYEAIFQDDFKDIDSSSDTEEILNFDSDEENKLLYLTKMGFLEAETLITVERCGPYSSIAELTDFICAAQMAKAADALLSGKDRKPLCNDPNYKKRQNPGYDFWKRKKQRKLEKKLINEDDYAVHLSNPMIGFGVPTEPNQITQRTLPEDAIGPPYFYYENVALAPVGVWTKMSRYLYDVEPDFVDSKYFLVQRLPSTCLGIPLKCSRTECDRLEQLMSRFNGLDLVVGGIQLNVSSAAPKYALPYPTLPEPWKGLADSKTGYLNFWNPENDRHGRSSNDVPRLETSITRHGLMAGENNLSGDAYRLEHEISDNIS
ncbi:shaggy-related protein kinase epsilon [Hibiscus syriacus]|uniref:Shaggy-related protein kinase epsilon n=1 Tax=Hibiscus syriacus TaxID=106335 RepID=A0A6A3C908_HIBSY|nr:shaggy-related protein kinase epsilon [Hibiscus syriacus]